MGRSSTRQPRARRETSAGGVLFRLLPPDQGGAVRFLLIRDSYANWGFPKGHLEEREDPAAAARREVTEETGLEDLVLYGKIDVIDWYFRLRGQTIHKFCHFFLFESPRGNPAPQRDEGITACRWLPLEEARQTISYNNARAVLERAAVMVAELQARPGGLSPSVAR